MFCTTTTQVKYNRTKEKRNYIEFCFLRSDKNARRVQIFKIRTTHVVNNLGLLDFVEWYISFCSTSESGGTRVSNCRFICRLTSTFSWHPMQNEHR